LRALNAAPAAAFIEAIVVGDRIRSWVPRVMAGDRLKIQAAQAKAHEAVVRTLTDAVYGKGQLELLDRICATDFVDHDPYPGTPPTLAGFRQGIGLLRAACPGLTFAIEDVITGDDRVAFRGTLSGTQTGSLPGLAPSGRPFRVGTMDIVRLRDGRIAEHWGRIDTAGLRQQVQAAAPAPAVTPAKPAAPAPVSSPRK
jgi:predicted ester cyclase